MPKSLPLLAAAALLILNTVSWGQTTQTVERTHFGQNSYPIWSPLSFFESQTIGERHAAMAGEPDALLALFVMASGRYSHKDYQGIQHQINSAVSVIKHKTNTLLNARQLGEIVNSAMHHSFFQAAPTKDDKKNLAPPTNYNLDQSTLAGIFYNHQFNCISASLLYAVLARKMNLDGQGVMLPSHAFIQLDFEDGQKADVETTSPYGYDQHHDAEFYRKAAENWFNPRGLSPSTYDDYLNRELIPFWQLGTRNMLHQHTHPGRMNDIDRGRLAEISALIDPTYENAQVNRMHYYVQEANLLAEKNQWADLERLLNTIMNALVEDTPNFSHNQNLQNSLFWLHLIAIETYAQLGNMDLTLAYIQHSMNLAYDEEQLARAKNRSIEGLNTLLKQLIPQHRFSDGLYLLSAIETYSAEHPHYPAAVAWFYQEWAKYYWGDQNWPQTVGILEDYFTQPYINEPQEQMQTNIASAYKNWVLSELKLSHLDVALAVVQQCQIQHFNTHFCTLAEEEISVYQAVNLTPKKQQ